MNSLTFRIIFNTTEESTCIKFWTWYNSAVSAIKQTKFIGEFMSKAMELELARVKAELANANTMLKAQESTGHFRIAMGKTGGIIVYGLGRFPTTLYKKGWQFIFANQSKIEAFIKENEAELDRLGNLAKLAKAQAKLAKG